MAVHFRRLCGVALCDLDDPDRAAAELDESLAMGLRLVWIPARASAGRAPGHPLHDRFWARLAEAGVPFVLHVGSGPLGIGDEWMNDGRAPGHVDASVHWRSNDPRLPRVAYAGAGFSVPAKTVVTYPPLMTPLRPAVTVPVPLGLSPAKVVNVPVSLIAAQKFPLPTAKIWTCRLIESFAHALPWTPESKSFVSP